MVKVIGHRGAAGLEPENTLRSLRKGIELGVDRVEIDLRLTKDGHLVVIHDATLDRTTNGSGRVRERTLAEIRALDAGKGERVPTLEEVLELIRETGAVVQIEMKEEGTPRPAVELVQAWAVQDQVMMTSFHRELIEEVRSLDPSLDRGWIMTCPPEEVVEQALALGVSGVHIEYHHLTPELVERLHRAGIEARAWTPNTPEEMQKVLNLGVDSIGTDRPDLLLQLLGRR